MLFSRNRSGRSASPVFSGVTRQLILLAVLALAATGAIGGSVFGLSSFAQGPCRAGDRTYFVVWGDTLGGIAARFHSSVGTLASYNRIANPNLIFPAERVCIPSGSSHHAPTGGGYAPPVHGDYVSIARQEAASVGISSYLFVRQINAESGFNPRAISPAGAIGIAQFMPATAAGLGINPYDPVQSLWGASRLMASYARQYGGNYAKALGAYNAGPGNVSWAVYSCGSGWLVCMPAETQNYVHYIMGW